MTGLLMTCCRVYTVTAEVPRQAQSLPRDAPSWGGHASNEQHSCPERLQSAAAKQPRTPELLARTRKAKHLYSDCHLIRMSRSSINEASKPLEAHIPKVFATFSVGMVVAFIGAVVYSNVDLRSGSVQASTSFAVPRPAPAPERIQSSAPETSSAGNGQHAGNTSTTTNQSDQSSSTYRIRQIQPPDWTLPVRSPSFRSGSALRAESTLDNSPERQVSASTKGPSKPAVKMATASLPQSVQQPHVPDQPQVTAVQAQYFPEPIPPKPQTSDSVLSTGQSAGPLSARLQSNPLPPQPKLVTVPSGTDIDIRLAEALSSDRNRTGDGFRATLDSPLVVDGTVVAGTGSSVLGHIAQSRKAPLLGGTAVLALTLTDITTADGHLIRVNTNNIEQQGSRSGIVNTAKMATGAAVGAVIGAVTGAAEGAGISSSLRDDNPTSGFMATRRTVVLQPGTEVNFKLASPLRVPEVANR